MQTISPNIALGASETRVTPSRPSVFLTHLDMTDQLFLITGGGTGAKVAESFVHLCAAGLGPRKAHILLIDTDASNGNLARTVKTAKSYRAMNEWNWSVQTRAQEGSKWNPLAGGTDVGTQLFGTELHLYQLTKPLKTVHDGGLQNAVNGSSDIQNVINLLYDEEERTSDCRDGFRARPNLGCLLLSEHLDTELQSGEAWDFLQAMASAISGSQRKVPVVVTASVFGGTGASLLPIAQGSIERTFSQRSDMMVDTDKLHWSAVKLLPHYEPAKRERSVDPDRFLLDTATALQYYSKVYRTSTDDETYKGVYIVGSDNPGRNKVQVETGKQQQSNPSYFEEFVAALAVIDATRFVDQDKTTARVFRPGEAQNSLRWDDLPHSDGERLRDRFAYLLHMASFYHRFGDAMLKRGLAQLWRNASPSEVGQFGWYQTILDNWASQFPVYSSASAADRPRIIREDTAMEEARVNYMSQEVAEYFGRVLFWAETALKGEGLELLDYRDASYASIYNGMASLSSKDIDTVLVNGNRQTLPPEQDNALVRVMRGALATMIRLHHGDVQLKVPVESFQLVDGKDTVPLSISPQHVTQSLGKERLQGVADQYTRTRVTA